MISVNSTSKPQNSNANTSTEPNNCKTLRIDFVGPLNPASTKGNKFILTISDYFSKYFDAVPPPEKNGHVVLLRYLKYVLILRNGPYISGHRVIFFKLNF